MNSNVKIISLIVLGVAATVVVYLWVFASKMNHTGSPQTVSGADAKNATYTIAGEPVKLVDGVASTQAAPGSASMVVTRYFGNAVTADLNGDGRSDTAFIITQNGSGTFYYAVAALNLPSGYKGSQGVLLGDRIAPQSTAMGTGTTIIFNYADRKADESFAVAPSVGKSVSLKLDPATLQFGVVAQNFEGEANPSSMTLGMKTWTWIDTLYSDGTTITPRTPNKFTLTFTGSKTYSASTDCNGVGGEYAVSGSSITFTRGISTMMYCTDSQESDYAKIFAAAQSYHFTSKGELIFDLKNDSGTAVFK